MLLLHSAILYGLVTGPNIDAARCEDALTNAERRGITPASISELLGRATS